MNSASPSKSRKLSLLAADSTTQKLPSGVIVGTEDTALLQTFNRFTAVLFLPPPELCLELDSLRKGLSSKNAADVSVLTDKESFSSCMDRWIRYGINATIS
jgi:hypothetical protein